MSFLLGEEVKNKRVSLKFTLDCKTRSDPPIPEMYFGNCLSNRKVTAETCEIMREDGMAIAVEAFNGAIRGLDSGVLEASKIHFQSHTLHNQNGPQFCEISGNRPAKKNRRMGAKGIEMGLIMVLVTILWTGGAAQPSCESAIMNMLPCQSYLNGSSSTPSSWCCSQLDSIVQEQIQCFHTVFSAGRIVQVGISTMDMDLSIPQMMSEACNMT
ncbi:hypothetical protein HHK36_022722 [Tetracentron sinense]|uniref:Bifunctional inhibitor/plant lipid transfer protein/seed storage helical domain-containing protein n=1 Tax=Tetracentron sinense TaxID=13715 RepID=A0A834YRL6_TETSI|nr:hypothetical protein HHK36_022722 [Tetracentron sinense]